MLARSNGYKLVYLNYSGPSIYYELPANIIDNVVAFDPGVRDRLRDVRVSDAGVVVALQKVFDIPFVAPLDVNTGATTSNSALAARYWTVFNPNAFRSVVFQGSRKYLVARALQYIRLAFGRAMIFRLVRKAPGFRTARAIRPGCVAIGARSPHRHPLLPRLPRRQPPRPQPSRPRLSNPRITPAARPPSSTGWSLTPISSTA